MKKTFNFRSRARLLLGALPAFVKSNRAANSLLLRLSEMSPIGRQLWIIRHEKDIQFPISGQIVARSVTSVREEQSRSQLTSPASQRDVADRKTTMDHKT